MEGFINLRKPVGPTSHDMVNLVRRLVGLRRVGHGGTLDPLGQGVLPIGVGRATRLLSFVQQGRKVYRAQVRLGSCTNTYDAAGEVMAQRPVPALGPAEIEAALKPFRGRIEQVPPPFSAIRRDGRRFYERARAGDLTPPPARQVQILSLEMISWQSPELVLQVCCGSGTYIRSLAHDLGQNLGCGAHLQGLQRLQVGPFLLEQALSPDELPRCRQDWAGLLLPLDFPLQHWPSHRLSMEQVNWALNGRRLSLPPPNTGQNWARAHDPRGRFLALLCFDVQEENWHPARVFPPLES